MINTPSQRCAIYTRQSRTTETSFTSCEAQHESALAIIQAHVAEGWQWNEKRYDDEGEGGMSVDRPALQRLLADVRNHQVDRVIVYRLDRLARKLRDSVRLINEFREHNVHFTIVTDPNLTYGAEHSFLLNILGAFSEFEYEMTRERLAEARAALKSKGKRVAGRVPYGYTADGHTKQLVLNLAEARYVYTLFHMALEFVPSLIARTFNALGWRTQPTTKYPEGGNWTPRQVLTTLRNPVYAGRVMWRGQARPGAHQPIVDLQTFEAVQKLINARTLSHAKRGAPTRAWALDKLLYCGECGRPMGKNFGKRGPLRYPYYQCRSHTGGRKPCAGVSIFAYDLERATCDAIGQAKEFSDLHNTWNTLTTDDQIAALPRVVERCEYAKNRLRVTLAPDAVAIILNA